MGFVDLLEKQGFEVSTEKITNTSNKPYIVTVRNGEAVCKYLLKPARACNMEVYDAVSGKIKTPTIVYQSENEVAYDFIEGETVERMIIEKSPEDIEAVKAAGVALRKLHDAGAIHGDADTGHFIYFDGECFTIDLDKKDSMYIGQGLVQYFMRRHDISHFCLLLEGDCRKAGRPVSDMVTLEDAFMVGYT